MIKIPVNKLEIGKWYWSNRVEGKIQLLSITHNPAHLKAECVLKVKIPEGTTFNWGYGKKFGYHLEEIA